ncbi:amidase [Halobacillus yeomjeoni]|uniref:amidase n=1 Tax=Halobacillus yeomjeoni TaxID=311194 RepID=UPI001CD21FF6|nr:amidase [Halobacillus yeomjeoni]MCA0982855.1 amidase [Halobacillus yeomjeoni]
MNKFNPYISLLIGVLLILTVIVWSSVFVNHPKNLGTWIWHTSIIDDDRAAVMQALESKGVTDVFLQVDRDIEKEVYQSFIRDADSRNMKVHALDGSPIWVASEGDEEASLFFNWLGNYQNEVSDSEKFKGIHLDVEPYLHAGWRENYDRTVSSYQSFIMTAGKQADILGIPLEVDIPFWFDKKNYKNDFGSGVLSEWVMEHTDAVTIMAYRDKAEGSNGIIKVVRSEIEYAEKLKKPITIAVETKQSTEYDHVSFHEEGQRIMMKELKKVEKEYRSFDSFRGMAIHSYDHWMEMKP